MNEIQINSFQKKSKGKFLYFTLFIIVIISISSALIFSFVHKTNKPLTHKTQINKAASTVLSPYGISTISQTNEGISSIFLTELENLNIHWIRDQISWKASLETINTTPPTYNWTLLDKQVQIANAHNIHIDFAIQDAPSWHLTQTCKTDGKKFQVGVNDMNQFSAALSNRYNGKNGHGTIDAYEIGGNEFDSYWNPTIGENSVTCRTPDYYVSILEAGYKTIKANSPTAQVGMFSLSSNDKTYESNFLNGMYRIDIQIGNYFDFGNFQFDNGTLPPNQVVNVNHPTFNEEWQMMHGIFASYGNTTKPIWVTKIGWANSNETIQNSSLQEVFQSAQSSTIITKVFWYSLDTTDTYNINPGDVLPTPTLKPLASFSSLKKYITTNPTWASTITVTPPNTQTEFKTLPVTPSTQKQSLHFDHIFEIIMENHDSKAIVGNTLQAPFFNSLINTYAFATNYTAVGMPSLPNYIGLTSGSTQGIKSDCMNCYLAVPNIADGIEAKGLSWKSYQESMPTACFVGNGPAVNGKILYAQKHNPFMYYNDIRLNTTRCTKSVVPYTQLATDLATNTVPNYSFITPNLQDDMHDGTIQAGDAWLAKNIPLIMNSTAYKQNGLIIITWDSGDGKTIVDDPIPALFISQLAKYDFKSAIPENHYSLLRTIEDNWNIPHIGNDTAQSTMREYFNK